MNNLWPEDIGPIPALEAPVTILREQASLLGKKTNNLVEAEVVYFEVISEENNFNYAFLIVAPALNNYRHRLFTMYYDINLYPITISNVDRDIHVEISNSIQGRFVVGKEIIAESEDDFVEILKKIFSAKKTKTIIGTLLSLLS